MSYRNGQDVKSKFLDSSVYTSRHCGGIECLLAGMQFFPSEPDKCCKDYKLCQHKNVFRQTASDSQIMQSIKYLVGVEYIAYGNNAGDSVLPQAVLDHIFCSGGGAPVVMTVGWQDTRGGKTDGGHVVTLAGTNGRGGYYLHDPLNQANHYQVVSYAALKYYVPPYSNGEMGGCWSMIFPAKFRNLPGIKQDWLYDSSSGD